MNKLPFQSQSCFLKSVNNLHEPIKLVNNQSLTLGRGPLTKINDKRCSRNQVSVIFDFKTSEVCIKQIGDNISGINGLAIRKGETHALHHGDRLELLFGEHVYEVQIEQVSRGQSSPLKRPSSPTLSDPSSKKLQGSEAIGFFSKISITNGGKWESIDNDCLLVYTPSGLEGRSKVASYDLDHTIITTKTGNIFPKNNDDWKIAYSEVPGKLKQLWSDGFKIVFFTNQGGIKKGNLKTKDFTQKLGNIMAKLGVPIQAFVSTGTSIYRKPAPGMWSALADNFNDNVEIEIRSSFYCGDAAGREKNWAPKKNKDFSGSDRLFAMNVGLKFLTPEEHFLAYCPAKFIIPQFNPSALDPNSPLCEPPDAVVASRTQELAVLVGYPGSGKSYFAKEHLVKAGYHYVNGDTLGSWRKCVAVAEKALNGGQSVVIDNTNPDCGSRQKFVDIAKKLKIVCRCFFVHTSKDQSKHNNRFRELTDSTHKKVSEVIFNMYGTKFQEPDIAEGFKEIVKVNFVPHFSDVKLEKLYKMYLI